MSSPHSALKRSRHSLSTRGNPSSILHSQLPASSMRPHLVTFHSPPSPPTKYPDIFVSLSVAATTLEHLPTRQSQTFWFLVPTQLPNLGPASLDTAGIISGRSSPPGLYDAWSLAWGPLAALVLQTTPSRYIPQGLPTPLTSIRSFGLPMSLSRALGVAFVASPLRPTPRDLPASCPAQARLLPPSRPPYPVQQPLGSGGERGRGPGRTRACPEERRGRSELPGSSGPAAPGTRVGGRRGARGDGVPGKEHRSETHAAHTKVPRLESAALKGARKGWGRRVAIEKDLQKNSSQLRTIHRRSHSVALSDQ